MKVISGPEFERITCSCGTVFQPEYGDDFEYRVRVDFPHDTVLVVRCPYCLQYCEVFRVDK